MIADNSMFDNAHEELAQAGIAEAVRRHDNAAIFDWFAGALNFQGVADAIATAYLEQHGSVTFSEVKHGLAAHGRCPKLQSYWQFAGCGYRKTLQTCSEPFLFNDCALPRHTMRNGSLNQAAYTCFFSFGMLPAAILSAGSIAGSPKRTCRRIPTVRGGWPTRWSNR